MKKFTDTLIGIKNIFCQQNSTAVTSAGCVEFTDAAHRTRGGQGPFTEMGKYITMPRPKSIMD